MSTIKQASFGHLAAALAKTKGWTAMERGILLVLLERAEPSRGWSTSLGLREIASLAGCGRSAVAACLDVAIATGIVARHGEPGLPQETRIVVDRWPECASPTRPPRGHHPSATRTPPVRHTDTPVRHTDTPVRHTDTPVRHTDTSHVIGTGARALVAAPLSDPLSDPPSRTRESAPTHTRTHATEPSPVQPPKAPTFEDEVREMCDLALGCKPPITRRGTHVGLMLSSSETQEVARLVETHGVAAVRDVLRECGGAEMPVAMAAKRLKAAAVVGRPQAHVPFEQPAQRSQRPQDLTPEELDHKLALWDRLWKEAGLDGTVAHS